MKKITIEDLVEILKKYQNNQIELDFDGTVSMNIELKIKKILNEKDYLILYDELDKKISLNNHQIMKIETLDNETILIKFDSFQTVKILF